MTFSARIIEEARLYVMSAIVPTGLRGNDDEKSTIGTVCCAVTTTKFRRSILKVYKAEGREDAERLA